MFEILRYSSCDLSRYFLGVVPSRHALVYGTIRLIGSDFGRNNRQTLVAGRYAHNMPNNQAFYKKWGNVLQYAY